MANANSVKLDVYGHDFFGPLYVGSEYFEQRVVFDTMTSKTTINVKGAQNAGIFSSYDPLESDTAKNIYQDDDSGMESY